MTKWFSVLFSGAATLALAACGASSNPTGLPEGAFWEAIAPLCGNGYLGDMTTTYSADRDWKNSRLILHFESCTRDGVVINFNITDDRTRTWTLTHTNGGTIQYRIDRSEGSGPGISAYGGLSTQGPDSLVQVFPIDEASKAKFAELGIIGSLSNVWTLALNSEAETLSYHVQRASSERGMIFDLSEAVRVETPDGWQPAFD
ncbi:MAG: hypothetical protein AAF829_05000 [Pseudomonadota bacterium]